MNFYFPLKPTKISIDSALLSQCEADSNYVAQRKKDGWRIQIHKSEDKISIFTRHNRDLIPMIGDVDWPLILQNINNALKCDSCIVDGEFLHRRTEEKETFFFWDIFEKDKARLRGSYKERKQILTEVFTQGPSLSLIEDHSTNFLDLWNSLDRKFDEGLVIKDLREPLYVNFAKTIKSARQYKILLDDSCNLIKDSE